MRELGERCERSIHKVKRKSRGVARRRRSLDRLGLARTSEKDEPGRLDDRDWSRLDELAIAMGAFRASREDRRVDGAPEE